MDKSVSHRNICLHDNLFNRNSFSGGTCWGSKSNLNDYDYRFENPSFFFLNRFKIFYASVRLGLKPIE